MSVVSLEQANLILQKHNCARSRYGLAPLSWDWQLATDAAVHAERCIFAHATEIGKGPFVQQGENLSIAMGKPVSVDGWLREENNFDCADNQCLRDQCGHWTQMLWHNTKTVGCAIKNCLDVTDGTGKDIGFSSAEYLVCRYSPPGNYLGQHPCTTQQCQNGSKNKDCDPNAFQPQVQADTVQNRTSTNSISATVLQIIAFSVAIVVFLMGFVFVWFARRYYNNHRNQSFASLPKKRLSK